LQNVFWNDAGRTAPPVSVLFPSLSALHSPCSFAIIGAVRLMQHAAVQAAYSRDTGVSIMKVRDLLDSKGKDIVSIDVDSSVDDAIRSMNARKISAIMVNEQGKTVGIFTERDVVRSYINSGGKSFKETKVRDAMVTNLIVAVPDDELGDISSIMVEKNIRHLPVLHNGRVIGMLSIRDIIQTQVKKLTSDLHYLRDYIAG
jgi:CBS domain-containing protein